MPDELPHEYLEIQGPDTRWWCPWMPKSEVRRQLRALWAAHYEQVDATSAGFERHKESYMSADRELSAAIIAGLSALGPAIDSLSTDRDSWKSRALAAEGREAEDEAGDVAAAQPAKDLVDALLAKVTPAAPDVAEQPTPSPEEATEVVNAAPEAPPADDGSDDAA